MIRIKRKRQKSKWHLLHFASHCSHVCVDVITYTVVWLFFLQFLVIQELFALHTGLPSLYCLAKTSTSHLEMVMKTIE